MLMIQPEYCTGCRSCELACSYTKEQVYSPTLSRVTVYMWEHDLTAVPMMCVQCEDAFCQRACPTGAISRDSVTGAMLVDNTKCIRCRMCVQACPFGGSAYDPVGSRILKCDLCGGDPACVKACNTPALQYVDATKANIERKRAYAARLKAAVKGAS